MGIGCAKQQQVAARGEIGRGQRLLEIPGAVAGIAIQHRADKAALMEQQAAVVAGFRVLVTKLFVLSGGLGGAKGKQADTADLEFGGRGGFLIRRWRFTTQHGSQHLHLPPNGFHQPVSVLLELAAFAQRINVVV